MKYNDLIDEINGGVGVASVIAGNNITIDTTDPANPVISGTAAILSILGEVAAVADLPPTGNTIGDSYIIGENLWVWTNGGWFDAGTYVGPQGDKGDKGWTPLISLILDGERIVMQVYDWTGGEGTKPTETGYISESGLVSDIALAQNIRGPAGAGDGNVNTSGAVSNNHVALFDGATGLLIKSGGLLSTLATTGAYSDLTGTPTLGTAAAEDVEAFLQPAAIGTTVQAYDSDTAKLDVVQTFSAKQTFLSTKDTVFNLSTSAISNASGTMAYKTISADTTFTDGLTEGDGLVVEITDGDLFVSTWPTMVWLGGVPTLTGKDIVVFFKLNSTLYGAYIGEA
jgi:hypothetical protein